MSNQNINKEILYKNYISTHFGKLHKGGLKEFGIYNRYFTKNFLRFLPEEKDTRILDIGCGMGHFLYFLEKTGYKNYMGVDISEENIEFCRNKGFNVKKSDALKFLQENRKQFNIVVLNDIIEHFPKREALAILELIYKNLTTGGKVIIKTMNCSNPIMGGGSRYDDFTHEIGFTEVSLSQVLNVCAFKEVKIYPQDIFIFYLNPFNYLAKFAQALLNNSFRILFWLYGRKSTKIFTKSIIGVGVKK